MKTTSPQRGGIAWADLLRVTEQLPRAQWADAAAALGAAWIGGQPALRAEADPEPPSAQPPAPPPTPPLPEPGAAQALQPVFWRVAAWHAADDSAQAARDWINAPLGPAAAPGETLFDSPPHTALLPEPLIRRNRVATLLRSHLLAQRQSSELDWAWLLPRLARLQAPTRWRLRRVAHWPRSVTVVWQDDPRLHAVRADLAHAAQQACQLLGGRARLVRTGATPGTAAFDDDARPVRWGRQTGSTVVFGLGDAPGQRLWADWALARPGAAARRPLLVAPAPRRLLALATAQGFQPVVCDDEAGGATRLPTAAAAGLAGSAAGPPAAATAADADALPADPGLRLLCTAIAGSQYVPLTVLRQLRRGLADAGCALDLGHEIDLLADTERIAKDTGGCALRRSAQPAGLQALRQLPPALRHLVLRTMWQGQRTLSPLVRTTYALSLAQLGLPAHELAALGLLDPLFQAALRLPTDVARALAQSLVSGAQPELKAYVRGLADSRPDLLAGCPPLATAWVIAARDDLMAGQLDAPPWLGAEHLRLLHSDDASAPLVWLRHWGTHLHLMPAGQGAWPALAELPSALLWHSHPRSAPPETQRAAALQRLRPADRRALLRQHGGLDALEPATAPHPGRPAPQSPPTRPQPARQQARDANPADPADQADQPATLIDLLDTLADQLADDPERWAVELAGGLRRLATHQDIALAALHQGLDQALAALGLMDADAAPSPDPRSSGTHIGPTIHPSTHPTPHPATHPTARTTHPLPLPATGSTHLTLGRHRLTVEPFTRPPWAESVENTATGWRATLADGRRLCWMAQSAMTVQAGAGQPTYTPPQGFWWDAAEAAACYFAPGQQLVKPGWASQHGVDEHGYWADFTVDRHTQRMRFIPPGRFWMGSPLAEAGRLGDETLHPVTLTRGCWLADTVCSVGLWQAVTGDKGDQRPATPQNQPLPMVGISHDDITGRFLPALARRLPGFDARLPTEAEWEYAARAGTATAYAWGDAPDEQRMNISRREAGPVIAYTPNAWGLWQMHGNVWEWCADGFDKYPAEAVENPTGPGKQPSETAGRVLRGGSWINGARDCRSAMRFGRDPGERNGRIGFRLARGAS